MPLGTFTPVKGPLETRMLAKLEQASVDSFLVRELVAEAQAHPIYSPESEHLMQLAIDAAFTGREIQDTL